MKWRILDGTSRKDFKVKATRGLADVWRAQLHGAEQAPAAISERERVVEEVPR